MRIMQIQPMSESVAWKFARRPVALALAGVVGMVGLHHLLGAESLEAATVVAAMSGPIEGRATAVDGDTLDFAGRRVRLEGIDAPELGQSCQRRWLGSWDCGRAAQKALEKLVDGRRVTCERKGQDKYGRDLGICFVDGRDLNAEQVRLGLAWAFIKYSQAYVGAETEARKQLVGIWQGKSEPAWTYRASKWQTAEVQAPDGCAIKGNVTGNGKIYHVPWGDWYDKVKVEANKGERWFCSERDAVAAGWRPAHAH